MNLPQLNTFDGIRQFIEENKVTTEQVDQALRIAYGGQVSPDSVLGNAGSLDAAGVLGLALHDYFPRIEYGDRVRQLLSKEEKDADPDLSMMGLKQWYAPEAFLALMSREFPNYTFSRIPASLMRKQHPEHQWYAKIVEFIYENDGLYGVVEVFQMLLDKLGADKRTQLAVMFKQKYPDVRIPLHGVEFSNTKSQNPESLRASTAQLVYNALHRQQTAIQGIQGFSKEALAAATALMQQAQTAPTLIPQPSGLAERLAEMNERKAQKILAMVMPKLVAVQNRVSLHNQPELGEAAVVSLVIEKLKELDYEAEIKDVGSHGSSKDVVAKETGERLEATHQKQAQQIVTTVIDAIQKGGHRPEFMTQEMESLRLAVASLEVMPALAGYKFTITLRGGYSGGNAIEIAKPRVPDTVKPPEGIEQLVGNPNAQTIRALEDAMIARELLGFVTRNGQAQLAASERLLETILQHRGLFSKPVFGQYAEKLLSNLKELPFGMPFYKAVAQGLPSLI